MFKKIAIFALAWAVTINSNSNEELSFKTLKNQQKIYIAFIRLIDTLCILDHCAIWKYIYQNWMERISAMAYGHLHGVMDHYYKKY